MRSFCHSPGVSRREFGILPMPPFMLWFSQSLSQEPEVLLVASGNPAVLGGLRSRVLPAEVGEIPAAARQASGSRAEFSTYPAWLAVHRLSPPGPPRPERICVPIAGDRVPQVLRRHGALPGYPGAPSRHICMTVHHVHQSTAAQEAVGTSRIIGASRCGLPHQPRR